MKAIKSELLYLLPAIVLLIYGHIIDFDNPKPILTISEQERQINFSSDFLQYSSLGQERFLASVLWIQTLLEGDLEHYKEKDLNSWMFHRFNTITNLDKNFYEAYLWGGQYLSVIKDDAIGAKVIYNKGLEIFPSDLDLNFNSGFNNFFELNDTASAIANFQKVVENPEGLNRFPVLFGLYQKLKYDSGVPYEEIFQVIETKYRREHNPHMKKYLEMQLLDIRTTEDIRCLNNETDVEEKCRLKNLYGEGYIKNDQGIYISPRNYRPYYPNIRQ